MKCAKNGFFNYSETFITGTIDITGDKQVTHTQSSTPQPTIAIVGSGRFCGQTDSIMEIEKKNP